jgi:hypothetical protein
LLLAAAVLERLADMVEVEVEMMKQWETSQVAEVVAQQSGGAEMIL